MTPNPLRVARNTTLDCIAINDKQRRLFANPSPERDSLFEHLQYLRTKYAIRDEDALPAFQALRELIELNDAELHGEQEVVGLTDAVLRAEHAACRPMLADTAPSIKRLASMLRPHLSVLAAPAGHSASRLVAARRAVTDIVRTTPAPRLQSSSLRHELRATAHDALLARIGGRS